MVRPEIQALRALAVGLVVVYHLWPRAVPGGFIGVDVFFVISGFLITGLLLREIERTGTVSVLAFWARRARRILPAALFTVLVCAVATVVFVPDSLWPQFLAEFRASTVYLQNWQLADDAVDYMDVAEHSRSPVEHFWSLSVEEQFYLLWPIVLISCKRRRSVILAIAALTAVSLAYSLQQTASNPAAAYFVTPARAWEFGAGGLLAAARVSERPAPALCWAGLAVIVAGALAFSVATPFPGSAALVPVLGTVAVIYAGAAGPVLASRLVQFLGDISYSAYLWHWPLLILLPYAAARELGDDLRIAVLVLTLLLAWLSKLLIEDPLRGSSFLTRRRPAWTFCSAGAATIVLLAITAGASAQVSDRARQEQQRSRAVLAARPPCFGAAAMDSQVPCRNPRLRLSVIPTPLAARAQTMGRCRELKPMLGRRVCEFGVRAPAATETVALVGDSHAGMWRAALDHVAKARRWRGVHMGHSSCPLSASVRDIPEPGRSHCTRWRRLVVDWFDGHPEATTLFVAQLSGGSGAIRKRGQSQLAADIDGYQRAWNQLPATVKHIIVIRDTPKAARTTAACVERAIDRNRPAGSACSLRRAGAIDPDHAAIAAARLHSPRLATIDLTGYFCDLRRCYPVIGGALVYKDTTHILEPFAKSLAPYLLREVERLAAGWE